MAIGDMMTDPASAPPAVSASKHAYCALLELIMSHAIPPGAMLREPQISEILKVSRTPLREALRRLEGEGLVKRQGGRGVVVNSVSLEDFVEALHARKLLEGEAAALAAARLDEGCVDALSAKVLELMGSAAPDPEVHWAVDQELHLAIARASGNSVLCDTIEALRHRTRLFDMRRVPDRFRPGCEEHLAILDAIGAQDAERARDAMTRHITNVRQSILDSFI